MISKISKERFLTSIKEIQFSSLAEGLKDYRENVLITDSTSKNKRKLFLYFPDSKKINEIKLKFLSVYNSMQKLIEYIIFERKDLLDYIQKSGIDTDALILRDPNTFLGYARIDTILGEDIYKVVEFNSRRPQMYEDADFYSEMIASLLGEKIIEKEENGLNLMRSISDQFKTNINKEYPETILVITKFKQLDCSFSTSSLIKKFFDKSKIIFLDCDELPNFYKNCEYKNESIIFDGDIIDLIFVQSICDKRSIYAPSGRIKNSKIAQAYKNKHIEIYTSPSGQISGTKLTLELLINENIQKQLKLSQEEIDNINSVIPKSIHSKNIIEVSIYDKNNFVIKRTGIGQGRGVILGDNYTQEEWENLIQKELKSGRNFILQEKINFGTDEIFDLQTNQFRQAYITLEPFIMKNTKNKFMPFISGFASRAILIEDFKTDMKFNPSAGINEIMYGAVVETK